MGAQLKRLTEAQFRAVGELKTMTEARRVAAFRLVVIGVSPTEVARENEWTKQAASLLRRDVLQAWDRFEKAARIAWPNLPATGADVDGGADRGKRRTRGR